MTPKLAKADHSELRKKIKDLSDELQKIHDQAEHKLVELSNLVYKVQKDQLFREWINPETKKPFRSFEDWIRVDVKQSKASVYRFIGVKQHLKLSDKTLELIGSSRCFELVKVAKEKPKQLARIVREIEKRPDMPVFTLQQIVTNTIAGHHFDSGKYERMDFAVKSEDVDDVKKAFAVMQAIDPVKNPEAASGRGLHLVNLCHDFLSGKEQREILRRLEKAVEFSKNKTNFKIED